MALALGCIPIWLDTYCIVIVGGQKNKKIKNKKSLNKKLTEKNRQKQRRERYSDTRSSEPTLKGENDR